jgi:hypothetical protein
MLNRRLRRGSTPRRPQLPDTPAAHRARHRPPRQTAILCRRTQPRARRRGQRLMAAPVLAALESCRSPARRQSPNAKARVTSVARAMRARFRSPPMPVTARRRSDSDRRRGAIQSDRQTLSGHYSLRLRGPEPFRRRRRSRRSSTPKPRRTERWPRRRLHGREAFAGPWGAIIKTPRGAAAPARA